MLINFLKNYFSIKKIINIFFIFVIGFVSRLIVNQTFDINVFTDCFHFISILYYFFLSYFICIIRDIINEMGLSTITVPKNKLNIPRSACTMVDKNQELNGNATNINSDYSSYNWLIQIHKDQIKENDFKEFIEKYKSSLEKSHSAEELNYLDKELTKTFKNKQMYLKKVKDDLPEDILVFYGMHINQKYGSQSIRNPDSKILPIYSIEKKDK